VTTGAGGQATLATSLPLAIVDPFLTATVTDPLGNTSEFSPCVAVGGPNAGKLQFYRNAVLSYEGVLPTGEAVITRSHGLAGTASVTFTSTNDTALAGLDYTDSDQIAVLCSLGGRQGRADPDPLRPRPRAGSGVRRSGARQPDRRSHPRVAAADLYIFDNSPAFPGILIADSFRRRRRQRHAHAQIFAVQMSPSDHAVTVTYYTEDGSAVAGEDYQAATGTLSFPASASVQTQQVEVAVTGDTDVEAGETLLVGITTAPSGGMWIAYDTFATGEIRNDDFSSPPPPTTIFADGFELGSTALWSNTVP
jgi:hypothetical protein